MYVATVNEGSRLVLTVDLFDYTNTAVTPTTLRYRVDCKTTGKDLVGWTSVTPSTSVTITIPASANDIQNNRNQYEVKEITIEADAGTDNAFQDNALWKVRNLQAV